MKSLLVIAALLAVLSVARHAGETRHPLLIQSAAPTVPGVAAPDLLFSPCPLGPRNLPLHSERKA